jgi:WD40 repeat protein
VAFSPKSDILATCAMDGTTRLWGAPTFRLLEELRGHASGIRCLAFSPDGSRLATGGNDATIRVWDIATRRKLFALHGHADVVYGVTFSRDGRYIASGSLDKTVKVWDAHPASQTRTAASEHDRAARAEQIERRRSGPTILATPGGRK